MSDDLKLQAQARALAPYLKTLVFTPFMESGSFTPVLVGSGVAGTFTYTANATLVEWTRFGSRLFYNGRIVITAITANPTLNMTVTGWPYAGVSDANMAIAGGGDMIGNRGITFPAGYTWSSLRFVNGSSAATILRNGSGVAGATVQGAEIGLVGGSIDLQFVGSYRVV